jgi:ubiquinone/menaquinone biosynthesis C-methylase UbiE
MFPVLSKEAAEYVRKLGEGSRDVFVEGASQNAHTMSLRHAVAYDFASRYIHGQDVLDLGCGAGNGAVYFSSMANVTAIDADKDLVAALPDMWPGSNVRWRHGSGNHLPFADSSFDVVTSFQVIEHVDDQLQFLAEIHRVLRSSGIAVVTTPNRLLRVAPWQKPWNPYHLKELTSWQLSSLFHKAGFVRTEILGLDAIPDVSGPERRRCLRNMLIPFWTRIPKPVRQTIKRLRATVSERTSVERDGGTPSGPHATVSIDSYWWTTERLCFSLDLLGLGCRGQISVPPLSLLPF